MALFRVETEDEGHFSIKSVQEDEELCTITFHHDMGGAANYKTQIKQVQKLAEALQKACYTYWNNQE